MRVNLEAGDRTWRGGAPPSMPACIAMNLLELEGVGFSFPGKTLFRGLDLEFRRGEITVVMGPSGCGKSSLLAMIGGRLMVERGRVRFDGETLEPRDSASLYRMRRRMGMLFQSGALLTDLDVFDNVAFPVREHTALGEDLVRVVVLMKLEMVGLRGAARLMPSQLSGGMARRVALARALVLDPSLVLYDEPFTGLDPISMGVVVELIAQLNDALGLTSLIVTHDVAQGLSIADRVYVLGRGGVLAGGGVDEIRASDDPGVRQFLSGSPDGPLAYHHPAAPYARDLLGGAP